MAVSCRSDLIQWPESGKVPLEQVLKCSAELEARAAFLRKRIADITVSDGAENIVVEQIEIAHQHINAVSNEVDQACRSSSSIRPRAKHALQALQSIVSVREYLSAVNDVRSTMVSLEQPLVQLSGDCLYNDDAFRVLSARTSDVIDLWARKREALGRQSLAHVWANVRASAIVNRWKGFLEKASQLALSDLAWPCSSAGATLRMSNVHYRTRAQLMLTCLCALQNAFEPDAPPEQNWALPLLTDPIIARFAFHFEKDSSATNRPDKPEWFLGFISRAISQHVPALVELLPEHSTLADAFISRLLAPVKAKLALLLKELSTRTDISLFSHCVKHVLAFEPSIADVLSKPSMRAILLAVERDAANSQLEYILEELPNPWRAIHQTDLVVTTSSADALLSTLFQITEKTISKLPILVHRLEFAALQGRLLTVYTQRCETFLEVGLKDISAGGVRTSSTAADDWATFIGILNSLDCIQSVLEEWSDRILFLELQFIRSNEDIPGRSSLTSSDLLLNPAFEENTGSFFAEECARISSLVAEFVSLLVQVVLRAFSHAASTYLSRGHIPQSAHLSSAEIAISSSICDGLSTLSTSLNLASDLFCGRCLVVFWAEVATKLDAVLFDGTVADKYITRAGAAQLRVDFDAIALLFRSYVDNPETVMPKMSSALQLLEMPVERVEEILNSDLEFNGLDKQKVEEICKRIITAASVETS